MKNVFQGFKEFISRGSAIDLAVGVVIGTALTQVVNALQDNLINPIIAAIINGRSLTSVWYITLNNKGAEISMGAIFDAALQFLLIAAAVYFFIVLPINKLRSLRKAEPEAAPAPAADIVLLQEIRDLLAKQK